MEQNISVAMKKSESRCIGCIFGFGDLPKIILNHLKKQNRKFVVVGVETKLPKLRETSITVSVGEVGRVLKFLKQHQVSDLVFGGKIKRPSLNDLKLDKDGAFLLAKLGLKFVEILKGGDDYIISYVMHIFKKNGYNIVSPQDLVPELLAPKGSVSNAKPSKQDRRDIATGKAVLDSLGSLDVGQAVVVENGQVLGIEAAEGTDALIARCAKLKKQARGGVLLKMKKTNQDTRTDLPVIGIQTLLNAAKAGLTGVAFEAGGSLIVDLEKVKAKANALKIFLIGI